MRGDGGGRRVPRTRASVARVRGWSRARRRRGAVKGGRRAIEGECEAEGASAVRSIVRSFSIVFNHDGRCVGDETKRARRAAALNRGMYHHLDELPRFRMRRAWDTNCVASSKELASKSTLRCYAPIAIAGRLCAPVLPQVVFHRRAETCLTDTSVEPTSAAYASPRSLTSSKPRRESSHRLSCARRLTARCRHAPP